MFQCSAKRPRVNVEGPPPVESDYGALSGNLSIWTGEGGTGEGMDKWGGHIGGGGGHREGGPEIFEGGTCPHMPPPFWRPCQLQESTTDIPLFTW